MYIEKYSFEKLSEVKTLILPKGAKIVKFTRTKSCDGISRMFMWVVLNRNNPAEERSFVICGDGYTEEKQYLGRLKHVLSALPDEEQRVWHLFEIIDEKKSAYQKRKETRELMLNQLIRSIGNGAVREVQVRVTHGSGAGQQFEMFQGKVKEVRVQEDLDKEGSKINVLMDDESSTVPYYIDFDSICEIHEERFAVAKGYKIE